jgi:hypothetical protein
MLAGQEYRAGYVESVYQLPGILNGKNENTTIVGISGIIPPA